jgi:hypothetical protein
MSSDEEGESTEGETSEEEDEGSEEGSDSEGESNVPSKPTAGAKSDSSKQVRSRTKGTPVKRKKVSSKTPPSKKSKKEAKKGVKKEKKEEKKEEEQDSQELLDEKQADEKKKEKGESEKAEKTDGKKMKLFAERRVDVNLFNNDPENVIPTTVKINNNLLLSCQMVESNPTMGGSSAAFDFAALILTKKTKGDKTFDFQIPLGCTNRILEGCKIIMEKNPTFFSKYN